MEKSVLIAMKIKIKEDFLEYRVKFEDIDEAIEELLKLKTKLKNRSLNNNEI